MIESLLQHADDLDYLQTLITSLGKRCEINPSMNAVVDALKRRRFKGRLKSQGESVELDTLLHKGTKGDADEDAELQRKPAKGQMFPNIRICYAFQKDACTYPSCRYRHVCTVCDSESHGAISCTRKRTTKGEASKKTKPPHPRYRRDRAKSS